VWAAPKPGSLNRLDLSLQAWGRDLINTPPTKKARAWRAFGREANHATLTTRKLDDFTNARKNVVIQWLPKFTAICKSLNTPIQRRRARDTLSCPLCS
jgi:hypothetical protein